MRIARISETDWEVRLECVCADDFGAGYKDESAQSDDDRAGAENYETTRDAHHRLEALCQEYGIRHYVADTDDRDSKHSDAYLYFRWSELDKILTVLSESGAQGDVLDCSPRFPVSFRSIATQKGWNVEETLP